MSNVKNYTDGSRRRPYEAPSINSPEMSHIQHFMIGSLKILLEAYKTRPEISQIQNFMLGSLKSWHEAPFKTRPEMSHIHNFSEGGQK